jgi:hypothetical protein
MLLEISRENSGDSQENSFWSLVIVHQFSFLISPYRSALTMNSEDMPFPTKKRKIVGPETKQAEATTGLVILVVYSPSGSEDGAGPYLLPIPVADLTPQQYCDLNCVKMWNRTNITSQDLHGYGLNTEDERVFARMVGFELFENEEEQAQAETEHNITPDGWLWDFCLRYRDRQPVSWDPSWNIEFICRVNHC